MQYMEVLDRFARLAQEVFGGNLTGVYLHGSAAMGCFRPEVSDLDLLVVTESESDDEARGRFLDGAVELNALAPAKGLEWSLVRREHCKPFVYPTPFDLHFSVTHLDWYQRDRAGYLRDMRGTDSDLAAHFTILNHYGKVLCGLPVGEVFGPVPREAYLDSIWYDVENAVEDIAGNPVYVALNLCRVLAYVREGLVLSKQSGGEWGVKRLPEAYRSLAAEALAAYVKGRPFTVALEEGQGFAGYMLEQIKGELGGSGNPAPVV